MKAKSEDGQLEDRVGQCAPTRILESMNGSDFANSVKRAGEKAVDAVEAHDDMVIWMERLQPYFDRHPEMTVAEALQLYLKDHPTTMPRNAKPGC